MAKKNRYYVVWHGRKPGIYTDWESCKPEVQGFDSARYMGFATLEEAQKALKDGWKKHYALKHQTTTSTPVHKTRPKGKALTVDAACSGNPGKMEYRGVMLENAREIFREGPFEKGTNNIGEFLAIVHALALQDKHKTNLPVYSDSANALLWVKKKKCGTKLKESPENQALFDLIRRAEQWLLSHTWDVPLYKWDTAAWGEIPADFGRK